jgi:hypothetical protein
MDPSNTADNTSVGKPAGSENPQGNADQQAVPSPHSSGSGPGEPLGTRDGSEESKPVVRLEAPGTGVRATWKAMGPGIAAAMTGIGASHIMHGPTAGAEYGYALLWIIPVAYLLKYCAFEFAHRYTMVRGESVFEAYERVGKGRGNWPLWYLGFQSLANTFGIAGRALGCGAMLWAAFPFLPLTVWSALVLLSSVIILWSGKYKALEVAVKICIIVFAGAVLLAFFLQAPNPGEYRGSKRDGLNRRSELGHGAGPSGAQNCPALLAVQAAPHTELDARVQCERQALRLHVTTRADGLCPSLRPNVGVEEHVRVVLIAAGFLLPGHRRRKRTDVRATDE